MPGSAMPKLRRCAIRPFAGCSTHVTSSWSPSTGSRNITPDAWPVRDPAYLLAPVLLFLDSRCEHRFDRQRYGVFRIARAINPLESVRQTWGGPEHCRVGVDFPHLRLTFQHAVVDASVFDAGQLEQIHQPTFVRILFQESIVFLRERRSDEI